MHGDDPQYEAVLAHCDTEGISEAMYDAIMAHRCHDTAYVRDLAGSFGGDTAKSEHAVLFECPAQEADYNKYMDAENKRLQKSIRMLMEMNSMPVSSGSATARIAK